MIKLSQLNEMFPTEDHAKDFLVRHRWPDGVECPKCGNKQVYTLKARPYHWQCQKKECSPKGYRFSVITGTIFENTKYPLRTWFTVAFMMLHSKKGMSALQIKRMVFHDKASYETVWYMCTRIRASLQDPEFEQLLGIVEVDETYIGGKRGNKHRAKRGHHERGPHGKIPVIGAISRKGSVVAKMVEHVDTDTCERFVRAVVDKRVKLVSTDKAPTYRNLKHIGYKHEQVDHKKRLTWSDSRTRIRSNRSGRCLSVASWAAITTSPRSTCRCI